MQSRSCQDTFSVRWVGGEVAIKTTSAKVEVEVEAERGKKVESKNSQYNSIEAKKI